MPKIIAVNKKAYHDYEIQEKYEAGIVLTGEEIKAIRSGRVSLIGSIARIINEELWMLNCHVGGIKDTDRTRKLLVHKKELKRLFGKSQIRGLYLIPLRLYFKKNVVKVEIALAKLRQLYDKREVIKKREWERERGRLVSTAAFTVGRGFDSRRLH